MELNTDSNSSPADLEAGGEAGGKEIGESLHEGGAGRERAGGICRIDA
jgi:hypothetical protein